MTRLIDADALLEVMFKAEPNNLGWIFDRITNAPTIEADSGEADAEVYSTAVYPNSNGMYEHTFLFNDRLAQQTELYLYNPNKYQKREWVELTSQQITNIAVQHQSLHQVAKAISDALKEVNHG